MAGQNTDSMGPGGLANPDHSSPWDSRTRPVTILFTDIVGSTAFYERWGDVAGRRMVQISMDLMVPVIGENGGKLIKTIGDALMVQFEEPCRALNCAVRLQRIIADHNLVALDSEMLQVRMGLHCGPAVVEAQDVFGDVVNTASRVESLAEGGEILLSGQVRDQAGFCSVPLVPLGPTALKGRSQPLNIHVADWRNLGEETLQASWERRQNSRGSSAGRIVPGPVPDLRKGGASTGIPPSRGNPYLNRLTIPHPQAFFGRRKLVRKIMERLESPKPQSVSLVGERRIGKSSLLKYLTFSEVRTVLGSSRETTWVVMVDFQQARGLGVPGILGLLFRELRRQCGFQIEGREDLEALDRLGAAVLEANGRLIFLLDEFEGVTRNPGVGPDFYAALRSLAGNYPVAFVCASGRRLKDLCQTREIADSPFFNIFTEVPISLFDEEEASHLVSGPSATGGIPLEPLQGVILQQGGLFPFFLQMACSAWWEYLEGVRGTAEDFLDKPVPKEVEDQFFSEAGPHFDFILETLPPPELKVLKEAAEGRPTEGGGLARELVRKGYLYSGEEGLQVFSRSFARYLLKT